MGRCVVFSLHALSGLTEEVALTNVQQVNGDIINNASDRYYGVKLLMDRALVFKANNDTQNYQQTIDRIGKDIDFLQGGLNQFKVTDHANISNNSTDNIYNSSLTLFNQAIKPMFEAVKANNVDSFTLLSKSSSARCAAVSLRRSSPTIRRSTISKPPLTTALPVGFHRRVPSSLWR